ncbi:calpastatin [Mycolicibacterium porcinum]|nr:calpastatin [Mycolicibacterium porcinum]
MTPADTYGLQRFVTAQDPVYPAVLAELREGRKRSHWIWFIFPQLRGLGRSPTAAHYGIASAEEARAYLAHPTLGPRLRECTTLVTQIDGRTAEQIFGWPDWLKVRSCMTLFAEVAADPAERAEFQAVLDKFYDGLEDHATLELLSAAG